jgi:hypothetical protein
VAFPGLQTLIYAFRRGRGPSGESSSSCAPLVGARAVAEHSAHGEGRGGANQVGAASMSSQGNYANFTVGATATLRNGRVFENDWWRDANGDDSTRRLSAEKGSNDLGEDQRRHRVRRKNVAALCELGEGGSEALPPSPPQATARDRRRLKVRRAPRTLQTIACTCMKTDAGTVQASLEKGTMWASRGSLPRMDGCDPLSRLASASCPPVLFLACNPLAFLSLEGQAERDGE